MNAEDILGCKQKSTLLTTENNKRPQNTTINDSSDRVKASKSNLYYSETDYTRLLFLSLFHPCFSAETVFQPMIGKKAYALYASMF